MTLLDRYPEAIEQALRICVAEYAYWAAADGNELVELMSMGATGAASNILAAMGGHRAPWHPAEHDPRERTWEDGGGI